jgi:hypothetical protein
VEEVLRDNPGPNPQQAQVFFQGCKPCGQIILVQAVTPDVLVKGEDWRDKGVVGREWVERHGGKVVLAPLLTGRSTSAIVERMRAAPPASESCAPDVKPRKAPR